MKKIVLIVLVFIFCFSCTTWHTKWAAENGYLHKDDIPEIAFPKQKPLPHPILPILETENFTPETMIEHVLLLDAAVQKYMILTEIYEREYCELPEGYSNAKYADKTIEELKLEYYRLLGLFEEEIPEELPEEEIIE